MQIEPHTRVHYIVVRGMLAWGATIGIGWTLGQTLTGGTPILPSLLMNLAIWMTGGAVFGYVLWIFSEKKQPVGSETQKPQEGPLDVYKSAQETLRADLRGYKILAWFGILMFGGFFVLSLVTQMWLVAAGHGLFLAGFVLFRLYVGSIEMNDEFVRHCCTFGAFQMRWNEVGRIDKHPTGMSLDLISETKRLPLPGPGGWSGPDKSHMRQFFDAKIAELGIPVTVSQKAGYRLPKNVRMGTNA